jgi:hypothetical protein
MSQERAVDIVTSLTAGRQRNLGSVPDKGKRFFFSKKYPDRILK